MKKNLLLGASALLALSIAMTSCSTDEVEEAVTNATNNTNNTNNSSLSTEQTAIVTALRNKYNGGTINMLVTFAESGAAYTKDQKITLTLSSSGKLFVDTNPDADDGSEIELASFTSSGTAHTWKDTATGLDYVLHLKDNTTGEIHEVNVNKDGKTQAQAEVNKEGTSTVDPITPDPVAPVGFLTDNTYIIDGQSHDFIPVCYNYDTSAVKFQILNSSPFVTDIRFYGNTEGTYNVISPADTAKDQDVFISLNDGRAYWYAHEGGTITLSKDSNGNKVVIGTDLILTNGLYVKGDKTTKVSFRLICKK